MNKTELESKHLAELHSLAAEAGVPRYRMLRREDLIEKLAGGEGTAERPKPGRERKPRERSQRRERPRRERRERPEPREPEPKAEEPASPAREETAEPAAESARPRRRRRRRFGRRRSKELRLAELLAPGRQTIVYGETREGCTAMLRQLATELADESNGSDPVAVLVNPGPEELAEWRREAPQAEIVAAAQARHAEDALAQAVRRAESGEHTIVLVDSLTRLSEELDDAETAKSMLDAGGGSLTVVAALERR